MRRRSRWLTVRAGVGGNFLGALVNFVYVRFVDTAGREALTRPAWGDLAFFAGGFALIAATTVGAILAWSRPLSRAEDLLLHAQPCRRRRLR